MNALTQNCAETFEFTTEDAQRILLPATGLDSMELSEDIKLKLERLHLKHTRLVMHGSTLSEYWRNKKIPRGLRIQKAPTIGKTNENFVKRWGEILNKCSLDLMLLIIEHVSTEASALKVEIDAQEKLLKDKYNTMYPDIDRTIMDSVGKYKEQLLSIKLKKYKRDVEDYQRNEIYHWECKEQLPSSPRAPQARPLRTVDTRAQRKRDTHRYHHDDSSLDSDFTLDSDPGHPPSNPHFLGNRPKRQQGRRNAAEGSAQASGTQRPWTRSKSRTR